MRAWFCTALAIAATAAAVSSCGGGGDSNTTPSGGGSAAVTIRVTGQNGAQSFTPNPASAAGRTVAFKNDSTETHRVVLNDNSIDTGDIAPGATSRVVTMPSVGANYHCSLHPGMIGQVFAAGDAAPPPCEGIYCTGY